MKAHWLREYFRCQAVSGNNTEVRCGSDFHSAHQLSHNGVYLEAGST